MAPPSRPSGEPERARPRGWAGLGRGTRFALVAVAVLLFLTISGLLARFLSVENVERDDIEALLQAQAAGSAPRMIALLDGCADSRGCVASTRANATRLHRRGNVKILTLTSGTAYTLTGATGTTRVAWTVIGKLPVVQCVRVRRTGNALVGIEVALLSIGPQIPGEADC